ncbi:MAG: hypothetical protein ABL918_02350 [Chakrabartia sp.]
MRSKSTAAAALVLLLTVTTPALAHREKGEAGPRQRLSYSEHNVWTGGTLSWQMMPSGKGKIIIPSHNFHVANATNDTYYAIHKGEHTFDLGPAGYAALRAGFDDIISGKVKVLPCAISMTDQPIGMLTWSGRKSGASFHYDLGCQDVEAKAHLAKIADVYRAIALQLNHEKPLKLKP